MRELLFLTLALTLGVAESFARAGTSLQEQYLTIYLKIHDAEKLEKDGDNAGALEGFQECYNDLAEIHRTDPDWEVALVEHRMDDCQVTIEKLQGEIAHSTTKAPGPNDTPSPAATTTNAAPRSGNFQFVSSSSNSKIKNTYPWKTAILATVFWIGEKSDNTSGWNQNWQARNHGSDSPDDRNGFAPAGHAAGVNPFYVALPFNDLAYPEKAKQWLPVGWTRPPHDGKPVSACQDRWLEIKMEDGSGRVCYAQWENVGPLRNDHAEYVFGPERPDTGNRAGIDVSPAVAQYLGFNDKDAKPQVRWRFVDPEDVPPGQWLKLDEQAVIYTAMHQTKD